MFIKFNSTNILDTDTGIKYQLQDIDKTAGLVTLVASRLGSTETTSGVIGIASTHHSYSLGTTHTEEEVQGSNRARAIFAYLERLCEPIEVPLVNG